MTPSSFVEGGSSVEGGLRVLGHLMAKAGRLCRARGQNQREDQSGAQAK